MSSAGALARPVAALAAVGLAAVLAGCSGSSAADPSTPASASSSASRSPATSASATATTTPSATPTAGSGTPAATGGGGVDATVPAAPVSTLPSAPLTGSATTGGIGLAVTAVTAVQGQANGPGQVAGPALQVTVRITNGSAAALSLDTVLVDLRDATGGSASPLSGPGVVAFGGSLAVGAAATGVYVFGVDESARNPVSVLVSHAGGAPVAVFTGAAP